MKALKLSFDLSDEPQLVEWLRIRSAKSGKSQKSILVEALKRYLSDAQEDQFILSAADKSFAEWSNPEDDIFDPI
jgi:hypothetical protein